MQAMFSCPEPKKVFKLGYEEEYMTCTFTLRDRAGTPTPILYRHGLAGVCMTDAHHDRELQPPLIVGMGSFFRSALRSRCIYNLEAFSFWTMLHTPIV